MPIIQSGKFYVSNIDKRETVELQSMPVLIASGNWVPVNQRGPKHESKSSQDKYALKEALQMAGFFGLVSPVSELTEMLNDDSLTNRAKYGSWFGDRIIMYTGSQSNPYSTNTNNFAMITQSTLENMGIQLTKHIKIMA